MATKFGVLYLILAVIYIFANIELSKSIPIDIASQNGNRFAESHSRPVPNLQQQSPLPPKRNHPSTNHYRHSIPSSISPEMEDSGRLHHKQSRRNSMTPPDVKVSPGNFHHLPPEQFGGANSRGNVHRKYEENQNYQQQFTSHINRNQSPPPIYVPKMHEHSEFQHGSKPAPHVKHSNKQPLMPPSKGSNHFHQEEKLDSNMFYSDSNEIDKNDVCPKNQQCKRLSDHHNHKPSNSQWEMSQDQQQMQHHHSQEASLSPQLHHTQSQLVPTNHIKIPSDINNNSTFFIEYDVSDNDVTYETTVEVDENSDANISE